MDPLPELLAALIVVVLALALLTPATPTGCGRRDDRDYQCEAEIEPHDIGDMLDAIDFHRQRAGRGQIGEELADGLIRSTRR